MAGDAVGVRVDGLRDLRRDLRAIDRALPGALSATMREAVRPMAQQAAVLAPKRSGRLAASLRPFSQAARAGIRSPLVYANPIHWGWPLHNIAPSLFAQRAAEQGAPKLVDRIGEGMELLAVTHGWR